MSNEIRSGVVLWPYDRCGDVARVKAQATVLAEAAAADDEWIGDVQLGTGRPVPGSEDTTAWPFAHQVAKREPGSTTIAGRPQ